MCVHAEIDVIWFLNFSIVVLFCGVCSHFELLMA